MTDPTGRSFLSYRRSRKEEAALLIAAQHAHGIPTWQDIRDLDEVPTEDELRRVLDDPLTANAILWITPDVANSPIIRRVEVPKILKRAELGNAFFVIPCAAGGLDYEAAAAAVDPQMSAQNLAEWNLRKVQANPIGPSDAAEIARRVLCRRLRTIHCELPEGVPLRLGLFTRTPPPFEPGVALRLDWTGHFNNREAEPQVWEERLLPALKAIAQTIRAQAPGRAVEAFGLACIPAASALGSAFLAPSGMCISWVQTTPGHSDQHWSLHAQREESGFVARTFGKDVKGNDCAVLVSVVNNVEPAFAASQAALPSFRAITRVWHPGTNRYHITTSGQALDIAHVVVDGIRQARDEYCPTGIIHLFMALPVGLAMLIGQLLNTFGPVQLYEHIPEGTIGCYRPAARLNPSL